MYHFFAISFIQTIIVFSLFYLHYIYYVEDIFIIELLIPVTICKHCIFPPKYWFFEYTREDQIAYQSG